MTQPEQISVSFTAGATAPAGWCAPSRAVYDAAAVSLWNAIAQGSQLDGVLTARRGGYFFTPRTNDEKAERAAAAERNRVHGEKVTAWREERPGREVGKVWVAWSGRHDELQMLGIAEDETTARALCEHSAAEPRVNGDEFTGIEWEGDEDVPRDYVSGEYRGVDYSVERTGIRRA